MFPPPPESIDLRIYPDEANVWFLICDAVEGFHNRWALLDAYRNGDLRLIGARHNDIIACREFLGRYQEAVEILA